MFSTEELKALDSKYFSLIAVRDYDETIMSRNIGIYDTSIIRSIQEKGHVLYFISIKLRIPTSSAWQSKYAETGNHKH